MSEFEKFLPQSNVSKITESMSGTFLVLDTKSARNPLLYNLMSLHNIDEAAEPVLHIFSGLEGI